MTTSTDNTQDQTAGGALSPELREALAAQRMIYRAILGLNSDDWLSLDLSMGQLKALVKLTSRPGMTVSEVAEALGTGKPAASMIVDHLTQHGYVTRSEDPDDRRRTVVAPTEFGIELVTRLRQTGGEQAMIRWIRQLAPDDLVAFTRGIQALAAVVARDAELNTTPAGAGAHEAVSHIQERA
ncbi:MAG TPA: MarR family transcriptional regulator [Ktedonobacterales bacterium]